MDNSYEERCNTFFQSLRDEEDDDTEVSYEEDEADD